MTQRRALLLALVLALVPATPGFAARWDTYNNANRLNSVRAVSGSVWTASDAGLHRYDSATGRFTRVAKSIGGLAWNSIDEVETDAFGTWFGTIGRGVSVQLDNGAWRTLSAFDGLPSDTVTALEPAPTGMWIGTRRGLALFDGFTLTAVWPDGVNPSPFASNVINDIAHVGDSTYVATNNGVYVTRSTEGVVWLRRDGGLGSVTVTSIKGFGSEVWCVAGSDVYRGGQSGTWTIAETGLGGDGVTSMTARDGALFVGAFSGVYRWDGAATWQPLGGGYPVRAWVDMDPAGGIWAGNVEGLWRWNGTDWQYRRAPGPSGNWVQGMQLTGSTLWSTTRDLGLSRFDGTSWRNYYPTGSISIDTTFYGPGAIFGLLADTDGTVWAGQWGAGIAHITGSVEPPSFDHWYDPQNPDTPFDHLNTYVWSSALDPSGNRYFGYDTPSLSTITPIGINRIGTDGSLTNYSPLNGQAMSGPQIRAIAFAPGSTWEMWVAYARFGVDVFTDPTLNTRLDHFAKTVPIPGSTPGLLSDDAWAIEFNGDDVWIGTADGLSRYSRATRRRLENVSTPQPSTQGAVHPLSIDAEGGVWWATASGLLHRSPDRSIEVFTVDNSPLLTNDVHSVIVDKATGDVWIGTVLGINRYNPNASTSDAPPVSDGASFTVYPNPVFQSSAGVGIRAADLVGPFKGKVYDVHGRVVRELLGNATTGVLWDGLNDSGSRVPPGVYFLQVKAGNVMRKSRVFLFR